MKVWLLVGALSLWSCGAVAQTPTTTPPAMTLTPEDAVAPVVGAIRKAVADDAALPPPASTREALERLGRLDQAGRRHINEVDFGKLTPEGGLRARKLIAEAMEPVDQANLAKLRKLWPAEGWFTRQDHGEKAASAAFHIVQHSADIETRKTVLPLLLPLAEKGEVSGSAYAAMYDRVAVMEGRGQRYGTQFHCVDGKIAAYPLENAEQVEALRLPFKLPQTFAEADRMHSGRACAGS